MEFKQYKLGELTEYIKGFAFKSKDFKNNGIPIIKVGNLNSGLEKNGEWVYIDEKEKNNYLKYAVRENDAIISTVGSWPTNPASVVGKCCIISKKNENNFLNQNAVIVRSKCEILEQKYLNYILKSNKFKNYITGCAQGSASQASITLEDIKKYKIYLPDVNTQKYVSKILYNIDQKIELNNQISDNLHKLLKNIYHNTFIDNKGKSWIKDKLGNYLNIERGLSYKGKFLADSGTPMINLGNVMPDGVFRLEKSKYYTGEYKEKVTANAGDIVVANTDMTQNREVIGTPVIIPPLYNGKVIFSHHIYGLKNLNLPKMYVFYSLLTDKWNGIAGGSATGTTVLALPKDAIEEFIIPIPDRTTLNKFEELAENIQGKREQILLENIKLEQIRDTLLPKLINGEVELGKIKI